MAKEKAESPVSCGKKIPMQKLSELPEGAKGRITAIQGNAHFQSRITSIGLTVGSQIEVIQNPKKQPILIYGRDTMLAINKMESDKIMVEVMGK